MLKEPLGFLGEFQETVYPRPLTRPLAHDENTVDSAALSYDYFSSRHLHTRSHGWQLLGSVSKDSVRCGFQEGLASKGQDQAEVSHLTQRLVSFTSLASSLGQPVLHYSQNSFLGALAMSVLGRAFSGEPGDVVWSWMSSPHFCQHTLLLICSPAITPVTQSSIYRLSIENSCLLLLRTMTSLQAID